MDVQTNYRKVIDELEKACERTSRNLDDIHIVAVTKYVTVNRMLEALEVGLTHIGESKVQDANKKWEFLNGRGIWHFIGHLQTNKVKDMIDKFSYIHSLDRISLAKEIEKRASILNKTVFCFVQVNISGEESKHGLPPEQVKSFIESLAQFPHIRVVGLMTMAPYYEEPELTRPVFRELKNLLDELRKHNWEHAPLTELSMGMSNDYVIAVEEGATFIRLGSTLVGE